MPHENIYPTVSAEGVVRKFSKYLIITNRASKKRKNKSGGIEHAHLGAIGRICGMVDIRGVSTELLEHFSGLQAVHARQTIV